MVEGLHLEGTLASGKAPLEHVLTSHPFNLRPVRRVHPLVRTHPVTGLKSLFYNPSFVEHLQGLKGQEAIHTLNFLREHLHAADDLTVRFKWEPNSVAFWDNRIVTVSQIWRKYISSLENA